MALFTDTVTIYNKIADNQWKRTVVEGVQWSEKDEKQNIGGIISVARYVFITFPEGTYENQQMSTYSEEDIIVCGAVQDEVDGSKGKRITDLLRKYPKSGKIQSVNDNSNRDFLPNVKVVIG